MGGALDLLTMLETAKDDKTRKEALKALVALSHSGESRKLSFNRFYLFHHQELQTQSCFNDFGANIPK